jgi:hypothetical protein
MGGWVAHVLHPGRLLPHVLPAAMLTAGNHRPQRISSPGSQEVRETGSDQPITWRRRG